MKVTNQFCLQLMPAHGQSKSVQWTMKWSTKIIFVEITSVYFLWQMRLKLINTENQIHSLLQLAVQRLSKFSLHLSPSVIMHLLPQCRTITSDGKGNIYLPEHYRQSSLITKICCINLHMNGCITFSSTTHITLSSRKYPMK